MSAHDVELAKIFLDALAAAVRTGDRTGVYPLLAPEVEWLTPRLTLRGVGEVRDQLGWLSPRQHVEMDFEEALTDLGGGRVASDVHETYRMKATGEFAYARDHRVVLMIRDDKVARFELIFTG